MNQRHEPSFSPASQQRGRESSWENGPNHSRQEGRPLPEGGRRSYVPPSRNGISLSAKVTLGAVVLLACVMILWYTFLAPSEEIPKDIPLITPPETPYKTQPEHPGGTNVPHQDVLVYNRMQSKNKGSDDTVMLEDTDDLSQDEIDKLLTPESFPQPTSPQLSARQSLETDAASDESLPPEQVAASLVRQDMMEGLPEPDVVSPELSTSERLMDPTMDSIQESSADSPPPTEGRPLLTSHTQPVENRSLESQMSARQQASSSTASAGRTPQKNVKSVELTKTTPATSKPLSSPEKKSPPSSLSRAYRVQVASLVSKGSAEGERRRLIAKFPKELGGKTSETLRVDLGPKGIRYRLLLGPYKNKESAQAACRTLAKGNVGCLVVKPSL